MERWLSGLKHFPAKEEYGKLYRGFESLPLRQMSQQHLDSQNSACSVEAGGIPASGPVVKRS